MKDQNGWRTVAGRLRSTKAVADKERDDEKTPVPEQHSRRQKGQAQAGPEVVQAAGGGPAVFGQVERPELAIAGSVTLHARSPCK